LRVRRQRVTDALHHLRNDGPESRRSTERTASRLRLRDGGVCLGVAGAEIRGVRVYPRGQIRAGRTFSIFSRSCSVSIGLARDAGRRVDHPAAAGKRVGGYFGRSSEPAAAMLLLAPASGPLKNPIIPTIDNSGESEE